MQWRDVSIPLHAGTTVWPGDPVFEMLPAQRIAEGAGCNTSHLRLCTHTGTHCDAPWHFEEDGARLHAVDTDIFFGEARLIDLPEVDCITAADLPEGPLPARVLFKTRNSELPVDAPFRTDYVGLAADAAERLADEGVRLAGIDALSIAPYKQPGQDTHHILLRRGIFVVEGLRLAGFFGGDYAFVVLPLPVLDADGAPCRAFLGR